MKKLLVLTVAVASVAAFLFGCGVAPVVGQYVDATSTIWVRGSDHVPYRIDIELLVPGHISGGGETESTGLLDMPSNLVVWIYRCPAHKCGGSTTPYVQTVSSPSSGTKPSDPQYDASDYSAITASVTGWGSALTIRWSGTAPASQVDGVPALHGNDADATTTWKATATVSFAGVKCSDASAFVRRTTTASPFGTSFPQGKAVPQHVPPNVPASARGCIAPSVRA